MSEEKLLTFENAIKFLPEGEHIHTFMQGGLALIGCDHSRESLIETLKNAKEIHVSGPSAQAMKHGLAVFETDESEPLFVETSKRTDEAA